RLISHMKTLAKRNQTTDFVVVLSAFIINLRRFKSKTHDNSIVIGYPVSGRNDEVKDLIGYFLNNTVLAVDIPLEDGLQDVILKVKTATTALRKFERIPFHELVAALGRHHTGGNHLFDIFFNYRHQLDFPTTGFPNVDVEIVQASMNNIFNLSITFDELPEGTRVMMEYNSSKYRTDLMQDLVKDMLGNFHNRDKIVSQPCLSRTDYPPTAIAQCLDGCYSKESRIATRRRNSFISYQELDQQICTIARFIADSWIKSTGSCVRSDDVITVDLASNDAVVVILAILKVGAAYAPMDKTWPESRKAQIIANLECSMSISDPLLSNISTKKQRKRRFLLNRTSTSDLIYVIHTSGSLGTPKGVAVNHRNVSAFLRGATPQAFLRPSRLVSHSVNIAFDVSVFNIFGSLVNGCELCMHDDLRRLPDEVDELHCDIVFLTSAMLDALTDSELNRIRDLGKLFVGGDTVHDRNLTKVLKFGLDVTQIYGPTEATVWSLANRCKSLPEEGSLIGLPMLNEGCWIAQGQKEGELILTGAKVARGYLNAVDNDRFG
ncbi:AMP-binding enzyme, partial [Teladorsagia circumcincta]